MKRNKWISGIVMLILLCSVSTAHADRLSYSLGDMISDFTFTTYDGENITLSEVLKEKEAVLINLWATWCGPCRSEFPYMQQAYQEYQDRIEIFALSCESTDTDEVLADFAKEYGLTFKIGRDPVDFLQALGIGSIPTTMMIDRYGTICLIESGAQTSKEAFVRLFDAFIGDDYSESVIYHGIPAAKPNVPMESTGRLSDALETSAENPASDRIWPMISTEMDGRIVLMSTNAGQASSEAAVLANVSAKAGGAIVISFKTSTESIFDQMKIYVNDELTKVFSGEHDWMNYAIPVQQDGEYQVKIAYTKDAQGDAGEDAIWVDRIFAEDSAEESLKNNPVYPVAKALHLSIKEDDAKEILMEDATGLLRNTFGDARYYIANVEQAMVEAQLPQMYDPERAFLYANGSIFPLIEYMNAEGYAAEVVIDSAQTTGYACTAVLLYLDATGSDYQAIVVFQDEENVDLLCKYNNLGEWQYAENDASVLDAELLPSQVEYEFQCVDGSGQPVAGVMLQICDESTCQVLVTDAKGVCKMTSAPYAWEVHILMAPEGYSAETDHTVHTPVEGGKIVLTLTKE